MAKYSAKQKKEWPHLHRVVTHLRHGALHRALGIPEDEDIPAARLAEAKRSNDPEVAHMARLAGTMEGWHHGGKKK